MDNKALIRSQYHATLDMLDQAIQVCPEDLWTAASYKNAFWHVAYHALYFTHLYLSKSLQTFAPWSKGHPEAPDDHPYRAQTVRRRHFWRVRVLGDEVRYTAIGAAGQVFDEARQPVGSPAS